MTTTTALKFTKVQAGWYATADGKLAVVSEGHGYINQVWQSLGNGNDGWAAAEDPQGRLREDHNAGDNVGWFDRKGDAVDFLQLRAR